MTLICFYYINEDSISGFIRKVEVKDYLSDKTEGLRGLFFQLCAQGCLARANANVATGNSTRSPPKRSKLL